MTRKISDQTIARRLKDVPEEVVRAFELQKTYNRLRRRRSTRTTKDFIKTNNYPHFIRLIRFAKKVQLPDLEYYIKLMIASKCQPSSWTTDKSYRIFLERMNTSINAFKSIEISARELQRLANRLDIGVLELVNLLEIGEIIQLVRQRRLSPWLIFQSSTLVTKISAADEGMQKIITNIIDPTYWKVIMHQNTDAILLARRVVKELGI